MVFCKGASIFTAYLCVLVKLMSLLQFSDDLEQKENGFNHLGEEAESKIKQCRTNSSLRSVLRPGKGGLFELSCNHGHLNVVKWLYRYFVGYNIDIHEVSCIYGKLKVAKWLYFYVDYVFASCCENGTLEAVHELYSLGNVDIHANDDLAFRSSCGGSEYHGAKWSCELCNGYTILVENDKIIEYGA